MTAPATTVETLAAIETGQPLRLPVVTQRASISVAVNEALSRSFQCETETIGSLHEAHEYLLTEMPILCIVDFSSPGIDAFKLLDEIQSDPWLLHGGIIGINDDPAVTEKLESIQGINLVITLKDDNLKQQLPTVMRIVYSNRRLLTHRGLGTGLIDNLSAHFELRNNALEARCFVNLLCNFLFSTGRVDATQKRQAQLALTEMLMNAIEHGNCGISYEDKKAWLESGKDISGLIEERMTSGRQLGDRVGFEYVIQGDRANFTITDQGNGFDWKAVRDPLELDNLMESHGRGIFMTKMATENLCYNDRGNSVSFDILFSPVGNILTPKPFRELPMQETREGEIIMREGEPSDSLYFIVKGDFRVEVKNQHISTLTPDDIFIGEMAFLLGTSRAATVIADSDGMLIPVTKKEMIQAIRNNPHYGLFLAKLLAERIARINQSVPELAD